MDKKRLDAIEKNFYEQQEPVRRQYQEMVDLLELAKLGMKYMYYIPTHFTIKEGGEWIEWHNRGFSNTRIAHAIKFSNGAIFDMQSGWRDRDLGSEGVMELKEEDIVTDKLVPRYDAKLPCVCGMYSECVKGILCGKHPTTPQPATQNNMHSTVEEQLARANTEKLGDYRVVSRGLLEHCLGVLEEVQKRVQQRELPPWGIGPVIFELKAALQTEKSELKAEKRETYNPEKVCGSFHISIATNTCSNCGYSKAVHDDWERKQSLT